MTILEKLKANVVLIVMVINKFACFFFNINLEPLIIKTPKTCGSLELCHLRCEHGLMKNLWGCFECKCAIVKSNFELPLYEAIERNKIHYKCVPLTAHNCNKFVKKIFFLFIIFFKTMCSWLFTGWKRLPGL